MYCTATSFISPNRHLVKSLFRSYSRSSVFKDPAQIAKPWGVLKKLNRSSALIGKVTKHLYPCIGPYFELSHLTRQMSTAALRAEQDEFLNYNIRLAKRFQIHVHDHLSDNVLSDNLASTKSATTKL